MDSRISMAVAAAVVAAMPLLAACGPSEPATGSSGASANGQAALPSASAAAGTEVSAPTSTSPPALASSDSAQDKKRVRAASEKFVTTVLTIGYPDKKFGDYTDRIKPLMTADGFTSLRTAASATKGTAALTSLYAQRARSTPKLSGAAKVTSLEDGRASAQIAYENQAQQKSGSGWKTIKSLGKDTVTLKLVKQDGKWLVEEAS